MPYPTPNNSPGALTVTRTIVLPADGDYWLLVAGALSELTNPDNYEVRGESAENTADFFAQVLSDFYDSTS